mmetsp:Transcript_20338/g.30783  ORF Transcript_20338/g.30783 Transcript_20338/m.30783 type:complete len:205 (+) Transcript_20338:445-1059(+)
MLKKRSLLPESANLESSPSTFQERSGHRPVMLLAPADMKTMPHPPLESKCSPSKKPFPHSRWAQPPERRSLWPRTQGTTPACTTASLWPSCPPPAPTSRTSTRAARPFPTRSPPLRRSSAGARASPARTSPKPPARAPTGTTPPLRGRSARPSRRPRPLALARARGRPSTPACLVEFVEDSADCLPWARPPPVFFLCLFLSRSA